MREKERHEDGMLKNKWTRYLIVLDYAAYVCPFLLIIVSVHDTM